MQQSKQEKWRRHIASAQYLAEIKQAFADFGLELRYMHQVDTDRHPYGVLASYYRWNRDTTWIFQASGRAAILVAKMAEHMSRSGGRFESAWTFVYYTQLVHELMSRREYPDTLVPGKTYEDYDPPVFSTYHWQRRNHDGTGFEIAMAGAYPHGLLLDLTANEYSRRGLKPPADAAVAAKTIVDILLPFTGTTFSELQITSWSPGFYYAEPSRVEAEFWAGFPHEWLRSLVRGSIIGEEHLA